MAAGRHVALNPVRATLVERAWDWPHSSVRAHLAGRDGGLVTVRPLIARAPRFADLLDTGRGRPRVHRAAAERVDRPPARR